MTIKGQWEIPEYIDEKSFDFEWRPDPFDPPYIHQFPTSQDKGDGPRFIVDGATDIKYHDTQIAKTKNQTGVWDIPEYIDRNSFDFEWQPEYSEPPFIHQFPTSQDKGGGPRYIVGGAWQVKYHDTPAKYKNENGVWSTPPDIDMDSFDWQPDINEPLFNHQFPSTHGKDLGPILLISGASEVKYHSSPVFKYRPLDIVFVSNGETGEQRRYDRLCQVAGRKVKWARGIIGRENALRRAAEMSTTEWFFCFPAKLSVDYNFDFSFQPNRSYDPKHYIFYAQNPLNGLVYGHQAAVCYNRQLVLETIDYGLDFTMSKPHDIVPVVSGIAEYNSDPIMTWRTAFREVVKLKVDGSEESKDRLYVWLSQANGRHAQWSINGAKDGVEYYDSVAGNHKELMKSFEWSWLNELFEMKYQINISKID